jgi:DNA repair protein RadA/Sms
MGFCPSPVCGSVIPLVEIEATPSPSRRAAKPGWLTPENAGVVQLSELSGDAQPRVELPSQELNRVLGGGVVAGSVVLLAGEPGVGKSTLLLQVAQSVASQDRKVLYVSGEESPQQIKLRSQRLGVSGQGVFLLPETDLDTIFKRLDEVQPSLVIVDSIQTLYCEGEPSGPGSVAQVREAGLRLLKWSKAGGTPVFVSGHMTKDGSLAGPRVLEHMVDVVMYLESQEMGTYRILRAGKNRFGSTTEVGVFEMTERGMEDVADPSHAMMSQRSESSVGAALVPVLEGSRALLLEVQALTSFSQLPAPRRVANGVDYNRMLMLTAVASRRAGLELSGQDIIANVAGGFRVSEPAADLGVVLAMASSLQNVALDPGMVTFGEVGLSGELRRVPQAQRRLNEAARLGLVECILPEACMDGLEVPKGMKVTGARTLRDAIRGALGTTGARSRAADAEVLMASDRE